MTNRSARPILTHRVAIGSLGMSMRTRDLRKPRHSVGVMIVGAIVALAGCAAQPAKTQTGAPGGDAQATPVASKPIDFHTLKETNCPSTAASYQEWVAKFQSYALSKGKPDAVIQTAFAGVKENPEISDRASKQPEFVTPVWSYLDRAVSDDRRKVRQELKQFTDPVGLGKLESPEHIDRQRPLI